MQTAVIEKPRIVLVERHLTQKWRDWIDADLFGEAEFLAILELRYGHLIGLATTMNVRHRTHTAELEELAWAYCLCKHCLTTPGMIPPPLWMKKLWLSIC